jgi:hypothetical protein
VVRSDLRDKTYSIWQTNESIRVFNPTLICLKKLKLYSFMGRREHVMIHNNFYKSSLRGGLVQYWGKWKIHSFMFVWRVAGADLF